MTAAQERKEKKQKEREMKNNKSGRRTRNNSKGSNLFNTTGRSGGTHKSFSKSFNRKKYNCRHKFNVDFFSNLWIF